MKSQLSFPIGGIVAFPVGANPSRNSDNWLECNGQSFNTSKYPELYKILGSNKVPNYQGMFLRGYGSQSYSQVNGLVFDSNDNYTLTNGRKTSTSHKSGDLGKVQGDSSRKFVGGSGADTFKIRNTDRWYDLPGIYGDWKIPSPRASGYISAEATAFHNSRGIFANPYNTGDIYIPINPKHYRYNMECTTDEDGGDHCSFSEYTTPVGSDEYLRLANFFIADSTFCSEIFWPTANEFRPANVAVKYWIRSR